MDVINVSVQQLFQRPGNPSIVATNNAVLAGVIAVVAAGNAGDTYYALGGPSLAGRAISVAASVDTGVVYLGLRINNPANLAGQIEAAPVIIGPPMSATPITANLAAPEPANACAALTNAAAMNGRIALINAGGCSYTIKVRNAQNAGAVAVVFVHTVTRPPLDVLPLNIIDEITDSDIRIPSAIITLSNANLIRASLTSPGVNITLSANQVIPRPDLADTVAWFSSRGPGLNSQLKPDIAAPGEMTISTARSGSGAGSILFNGTSAASPFVAGAMALLRQMHPDWSIEELKALIMNTATFDLFAGANSTPPKYGLGRIGAGRIALQNAVAANVVAYNATDPGLVSVSFGVVEVVGTATLSKTIRVVNKGAAAMTYQLAYAGITDVPGVSFSLPGGNTITVPANGSTTFEVRLNATAAQMKHTRDATVFATDYATPTPNPRHWLSEEGGYITLTPASGPLLRVPVYAAPRPASNMTTSQTQLSFTADSGALNLNLTGQGVNTGTAYPTDELSLVHPFELADISPNDDAIPDSLDLKYVGVRSNFRVRGSIADTTLYFGIATHGNWSTPSEVEVTVGIDTNRDGVDDFEVRNGATHSDFSGDAFIVRARNAATGVIFSRSFFLNSASAAQYNSVPYNTNVMVLLVRAADLGLTDADARFDYHVRTRVRFTEEVLDRSKRLTYDAARPGLSFSNFDFWFDRPGNTIAAQYNRADFYAAGSRGALLLHHHNTAGNHDQVLFAPAFAPTLASLNPNSALIGSPAFTLTVNGANFNTGSVVRWNGSDRITSFVSTTRLTANIPASDLSAAGAASVTVFTPAPGGGVSNALSFTVIIQGYEADVAPRPNGDNNGTVTAADWAQIGRFVSGLDVVGNGSEFQRADCAPRSSLGDGRITVADWVQAGRYAAGLDPVAPAGGPTTPASVTVAMKSNGVSAAASWPEPAKLRVVKASGRSGRINSLTIQLDARGGENAIGFSLHFDPRQARFAGATLSRELGHTAFFVNARQAASGRIGVVLSLPAGARLPGGAQSLMTIHFSAAAGRSIVNPQVSFGDEPVAREVADVSANSLMAAYAESRFGLNVKAKSDKGWGTRCGRILNCPFSILNFLQWRRHSSRLLPAKN
jgi:hypothetical protein